VGNYAVPLDLSGGGEAADPAAYSMPGSLDSAVYGFPSLMAPSYDMAAGSSSEPSYAMATGGPTAVYTMPGALSDRYDRPASIRGGGQVIPGSYLTPVPGGQAAYDMPFSGGVDYDEPSDGYLDVSDSAYDFPNAIDTAAAQTQDSSRSNQYAAFLGAKGKTAQKKKGTKKGAKPATTDERAATNPNDYAQVDKIRKLDTWC
jgi:hypothetical protein